MDGIKELDAEGSKIWTICILGLAAKFLPPNENPSNKALLGIPVDYLPNLSGLLTFFALMLGVRFSFLMAEWFTGSKVENIDHDLDSIDPDLDEGQSIENIPKERWYYSPVTNMLQGEMRFYMIVNSYCRKIVKIIFFMGPLIILALTLHINKRELCSTFFRILDLMQFGDF